MMNSLGSILKNLSQPTPLMRGVNAALTVEAGNAALVKLFGAQIGQHASAAFVKQGTLSIACLSSTAAQEIKLQEKTLLDLINQGFQTPVIKKIRCIS